jgi:hypothetical protein
MAKVVEAVLQILAVNAPKKKTKKKEEIKESEGGNKKGGRNLGLQFIFYIEQQVTFSHNWQTILLSALFNKFGSGQ